MCGPLILAALPALAGAGGAAAAGGTLLGTLSTVATIGGGLISAFTQVQNSKAQEKAAMQTSAAQEKAALDSLEQGQQESDRRQRAGSIAEGENIAAFAANGLDVGGDAAQDILADNAAVVREDAFTIRENSRRQAGNFAQSSANSQASASSARSDALFKPISTLIGTASKVGNKYSAWSRNKNIAPQGAF